MPTRNAVDILHRRIKEKPEQLELLEKARLNADVAQLIYDARVAAGLTQQQLAEKIGSTQPVISRLENADYDGHSLSMLHRIAAALDRRLELRFSTTSVAPK